MGIRALEFVEGCGEELEGGYCVWLDFSGDEPAEQEARDAVTEDGEGFVKELRREHAEAERTPPNC